jgi:hypothetical protein
MFAHNPLHGSGQAGFPHPALSLGEDAHATQGIGMTDGRHREPASDEAPHAIPKDAAFLAAPRKRAMPEPPHLESKEPQRVLVQGHSVIPEVSTHHRYPGPIIGDITSPLFGFANRIAGGPNGEGLFETANNRRLEAQVRFTF